MTEALEEYIPLIRRMAWTWYNRMGTHRNPSFEVDDLVHVGMVALCESRERFDAKDNTVFWGFARFRVEGAIIDFLRRTSLVRIPPKKQEQLKQLHQACDYLARKQEKAPTPDELAGYLNLSVEEVGKLKSLEMTFDAQAMAQAEAPSALDESLRRQVFVDMEDCLDRLAEEEKLILLARRIDKVGLKELAAAFQVSHETIRRREMQSLVKMRECLEQKDWQVTDLTEM